MTDERDPTASPLVIAFLPRFRAHRYLLVTLAVALTATTVSFVAGADDAAAAACCRTAAWPSAWVNPISGTSGGNVSVTTNFGAFNLGCSNADRSAIYTYYLDTGYNAHLGLDLARGLGLPVYAVAGGTVLYSNKKWGAANGDVVLVQSTASDGTKFVVTYGHLTSQVASKVNQPIIAGTRIGTVINPGGGAHLHLGLRSGTGTTEQPTIQDARRAGTTTCSLAGNTSGMVDAISWLSAHRPVASSGAVPVPDDVSPKRPGVKERDGTYIGSILAWMPGVTKQSSITEELFGLRVSSDRACWYGPMTVTGGTLAGVTAVEVRRRASPGSTVLSLPFTKPPNSGASGYQGCATAPATVLSALVARPWEYFVRHFTRQYPNGVMQGTLNGGHYGVG